MKKAYKHIASVAVSLLLSVLFIAVFLRIARDIEPVPEATGQISQIEYIQNEETGETSSTEIVSVIGEDVSAIRISDIGDLCSITRVNYVPDRFITPGTIPRDVQIVDLTEDFQFAEKGTLIFIILNLDPFSADFFGQTQELEKYKMGDYWHFTISLPQIFGASNIYVNSQLSARNGEISYRCLDGKTVFSIILLKA